jgi:hypothetical protein
MDPQQLGAWRPAVIAALAAYSVSLHLGAGSAWAASTQYGCSFSVPKPSIKDGKANFTVTASCASSRDKRKLDVQLVADDPSYDDTLRDASTSIPAGKGKYSVTGKKWGCHEDSSGKDEVYLRARIETHHGKSWQKAKWVNGSATSGDCH